MISVTDCRINKQALITLSRYGYSNIPLPPFSALQKGIAAHPDMLIFIFDKKLLTSKAYYSVAKCQIDEIIKYTGFELVALDEAPSGEYPNDVLFNAVVVGKYLIANMKTVSKKVIEITSVKGITPINVKQGYAKCSVCKVSDNAVITSDMGIYNTLLDETDLYVLLVREGFVELSGYNYGFIGGSSGCDGKNVYFCGDLYTHPDGDKIAEFCKLHGKKAVSLSKSKLFDVGTIFLF